MKFRQWFRQYLPAERPGFHQFGLIFTPLFVAALMLALNRFAVASYFMQNFSSWRIFRGYTPNELRFLGQTYYTLFSFGLFVLLPLLYHWIWPLREPNPFGLKVRGTLQHYPIYLFLLLVMVPILWIACGTENFNRFYPLYDPPTLSLWLLFELVYLTTFFSVEFFFRGFMLYRFEKIFRYHAISVMVLPYAFIHMYKPFPEGLASIVAGVILGYLSLKSRTIWPGILLHAGVAFLTDLFSLLRSGRLALFWT